MSHADFKFSKVAAATFVSALAMIVLPACEKGLVMKDPRITTADFKVKTQNPAAAAGVKQNFEIDLKSVKIEKLDAAKAQDATSQKADEAADATVKDAKQNQNANEKVLNDLTLMEPLAIPVSGAVSAGGVKDIAYRGTIEFSIGASKEKARTIVLEADIVSNKDQNSSGKILNEANEPEMTWQGRCADESCSKLFVSIAFHFNDKDGRLVDAKNLVISAHSENGVVTLVKRNLFEGQIEELNTLKKQIQALESMDVKKVRMQTPDVSKEVITAKTDKAADAGIAADDADAAAEAERAEQALDPHNDGGDANEEY